MCTSSWNSPRRCPPVPTTASSPASTTSRSTPVPARTSTPWWRPSTDKCPRDRIRRGRTERLNTRYHRRSSPANRPIPGDQPRPSMRDESRRLSSTPRPRAMTSRRRKSTPSEHSTMKTTMPMASMILIAAALPGRFGGLRGFGQYRHAVHADREEPAGDLPGEMAVRPVHPDLARLLELPEQRCVAGHDPELTLGRPGDEHVGVAGPDALLDGHDVDVNLIGHRSPSVVVGKCSGRPTGGSGGHPTSIPAPGAAPGGPERSGYRSFINSCAWRSRSSRPPHMKNACSGKWSYSPSLSFLNASTVS